MATEPTAAAPCSDPPDYLIVGGGTAGCVLAARLSEDPAVRVVLVEAGPDVSQASMPPEIRSGYPGKAYFTRAFFFDDLTARTTDIPGQSGKRVAAQYEQARVLGGGSSINGLVGNRGSPDDYDEWEALGAAGWGWDEVLPYFRKLERDQDFDGEYHGSDGPIPIRRLKPEECSGFTRACVEALAAQGFERIEDQNGAWRDGVMRVAVTMDADGQRVSAATGYLTPHVRARANLRVLTGTRVERLVFDGRRVTGAVAAGGDAATAQGDRNLTAREVIVTAGAINTPALLMRSGIGPAAALAALGIAVVADAPGVGERLREHPALGISCFLKADARFRSTETHHTQAHLRFSSGLDGCPPSDLHMALLARSAWHRLGEQLGTFYLWVNKPYSEGSVTLASPDPAAPPLVDFRLLSDPRDLARMRHVFRYFAAFAGAPALDGVRGSVFPTIFSDRVRKVSRPGAWNQLQLAVLAGLLDRAGPLRDRLIRALISQVDLKALLADEAALDAYLAKAVVGVWHANGTCRMGPADDPRAVTDPAGRVRGVAGLRVADASVMPSIPRANTNLPVIMLAERMADLVKAGA